MAKYKAYPFYDINAGEVRVQFDFYGDYETEDDAEIAVIDALCPTWVTRVDGVVQSEEKAPKGSAKASAK